MRSRLPVAVAVAVAVAAALLLSWAPARDPDLWWHLATGRAVLATRSTLPVDPFSFSFAGAPWRYKDLVADVALWSAFAHGGFAALLVVRLGCAAAMALGFSLVLKRPLALTIALGAMLVLPWADRPNLLSLALFPTVLALLERRRFGWLVLVTWVWIVLHRAALLGYVLIAARALELVVTERRSRQTWTAVGCAIAAPLVGLVNPAGRAAFTSGVDVAGSAILRMYIAEWKELGAAAWWSWPGALAAVALAAVAARLVQARRRGQAAEVGLWHLALVVGFAILATRSVRFLPYLGLVSTYAIARVVDARPRPTARAWTALAAVALVTLAFVARRGAPFALGEDASVEPVGAVAFARTHGLDGPLQHSYEFGGYLLWRGVRVLVDGRLDQVYPPSFVADCIRAERYPAVRARLPLAGVTWALGSNHPARWTHRDLFADPAWAEVYWSDAASVYVKRAAHPELMSLAFAVIDPGAPEPAAANAVRSRDPARIAAARDELSRMLAASPTSVRANRALAIYFHLLGRAAERDTVLGALPPEEAAELRRRFSAAARAN